MKYNIIKVHHGTIADEESDLTLLQLCNTCSISPEFIIEMIEEGILEPEGEKRTAWRFSHEAIESARKVMRFRRDLNVNLAGAALALELLDKIERLEAMLQRMR